MKELNKESNKNHIVNILAFTEFDTKFSIMREIFDIVCVDEIALSLVKFSIFFPMYCGV